MNALQEEDCKQVGQDLQWRGRSVPNEVPVDPTIAYAREVRVLRKRVASLEAELAATKVSQAEKRPVSAASQPVRQASPALTSTNAAPDVAPHAEPKPQISEFTESAVPAVQPAGASQPAKPVADPESATGFAQAWTQETEDSSFEERLAEKAFFQASTVDQQSRRWLLED